MGLQHLGYRKLPSGANAITQGEEGREFFIILKGSVSVLVKDPGNGEESQIAVLGPGGSFGDLALMEPNSIRRASCQCREDTAFAILHQMAYEQCVSASVPCAVLPAWCTCRQLSLIIKLTPSRWPALPMLSTLVGCSCCLAPVLA